MFFFVWFFIPETKGMSLEAMDELFGVTDKSEKNPVDQKDSVDGIDSKREGATTEIEVR